MKAVVKAVFKHFEEVIGCGFLVLFVGLTIINVILRYFFGFILSWVEEVIVIAFVWSVYTGSITAFRTDRHVSIDVLVKLLPKKAQRIIEFWVDVLVLGFSLYMAYLGVILCMNVGVKSTMVLRINYVYVNMSVVICFGMISIFGVVKLIRRFTGKHGYAVDQITH